MTYQVGDRVRIDIPDSSDADHRYHGNVGQVVEITEDDLSEITGDQRDDYIYRVSFDDESLGRMSFRHHDLERIE